MHSRTWEGWHEDCRSGRMKHVDCHQRRIHRHGYNLPWVASFFEKGINTWRDMQAPLGRPSHNHTGDILGSGLIKEISFRKSGREEHVAGPWSWFCNPFCANLYIRSGSLQTPWCSQESVSVIYHLGHLIANAVNYFTVKIHGGWGWHA